MINQP